MPANAPLRRGTVLCTGCNTVVYPTGLRWNPFSRLCLACHSQKTHADTLRHAQHRVHNDDDVVDRSTAVTLTIRLPPRRPCSLCHKVIAVVNLQHLTQPTRCRSCQRRERCSRCSTLKKKKHFQDSRHESTSDPRLQV